MRYQQSKELMWIALNTLEEIMFDEINLEIDNDQMDDIVEKQSKDEKQ